MEHANKYKKIRTYIHTHTYIHIRAYIHTHTICRHKMADEVEQQVEESLNMVVITTEQSSNMRKALKQKIFETVSTLRTLFAKLKDQDTR